MAGHPDLIHVHAYGYFPTFVGGLAQMLKHVPLVATTHCDPGSGSLSKRFLDLALPALTIRRAHRIIALTRSEAAYLARVGIPENRIRIVPNGVDLEEFPMSANPPRNEPKTRVLFVGRGYLRQKGLLDLVRATGLVSRDLDIRLVIAGEDWGGHESIRSLARKSKLHDRIEIVGPLSRPDLLHEYASADILVLPSQFESFPIVLLEAMAAGLPVVATRVGGIPDILDEGETGVLVEPGNPLTLAKALEGLVRDGPSRRNMGRRARAKAMDFSWGTIVPKIRQVYKEAIEECSIP